jgi:hypothetical protein
MADACPGISPSKLVRINTLYIRDETYTKARAQIVNYHHELAFAANFGQPPTLSVFARAAEAKQRGGSILSMATNQEHSFILTFRTNMRPFTAKSLTPRRAMPLTCLMDYSTTRPIFRLRSTTLTQPASPTMSSHSVIFSGFAPVTTQRLSALIATALTYHSSPRSTTGLAAGSFALRSQNRSTYP